MYIGTEHTGETFIDVIGNCEEEVIIREDGCGVFKVKRKICISMDRKIKRFAFRKEEKNVKT